MNIESVLREVYLHMAVGGAARMGDSNDDDDEDEPKEDCEVFAALNMAKALADEVNEDILSAKRMCVLDQGSQ